MTSALLEHQEITASEWIDVEAQFYAAFRSPELSRGEEFDVTSLQQSSLGAYRKVDNPCI